jgi:Ran GTPase-activating protein (RanGAP) involved in mRNA processing and transport
VFVPELILWEPGTKTMKEDFNYCVRRIRQNDRSLQGLDLSYRNIGDKGAIAIAEALNGNKTLLELNLKGNQISDVGGKALTNALVFNTSMQVLNVDDNNLSRNCKSTLLAQVSMHPDKIFGMLTGNKPKRAVMQNQAEHELNAILQRMRSNDSNFTSLDLSAREFNDNDACALAEALKCNSTLEAVRLFYNQVSARGVASLANALVNNRAVTFLLLGKNLLGDEGVVALASMLESNTTITCLELTQNGISDDGLCSLANSLKKNSTLKYLEIGFSLKSVRAEGATALVEIAFGGGDAAGNIQHMEWLDSLTGREQNRVGDESATALAEALLFNNTLTRLFFDGTLIGDSGAIALAESIKASTTLEVLALSDGCIGDAGAKALANAVKLNGSLQMLYLDANDIGDPGAIGFCVAMKYNCTLKYLGLTGNRRLSAWFKSDIEKATLANKIGGRKVAPFFQRADLNNEIARLQTVCDSCKGVFTVEARKRAVDAEAKLKDLRQNIRDGNYPTAKELQNAMIDVHQSVDSAKSQEVAMILVHKLEVLQYEYDLEIQAEQRIGSVADERMTAVAAQDEGSGGQSLVTEDSDESSARNVVSSEKAELGHAETLEPSKHCDVSEKLGEFRRSRTNIESRASADSSRNVGDAEAPSALLENSDKSELGLLETLEPSNHCDVSNKLDELRRPNNTETVRSSRKNEDFESSSATRENVQSRETLNSSRLEEQSETPATALENFPKSRVELESEISRLTSICESCKVTADKEKWKEGLEAEHRISAMRNALSSGKYPTSAELEHQISELTAAIQRTVEAESLAAAMPMRDRLELLMAELDLEKQAERRVRQAKGEGLECKEIKEGRGHILRALRAFDSPQEASFIPMEYIALITSNFTEKIGSGGFGVVYKGRDPKSGVVVAIKSIPNDRLDESEKDNFKNEIEVRLFLSMSAYGQWGSHSSLFLILAANS